MTTAISSPAGSDAKVIGFVGIAHLASHFYQLVLPPLFPFLKEAFGVSYTQLGLMMGCFFVASGVCQIAAGFAVDRFGARRVLLFGLTTVSLSILLAGLAPSFWVLIVLAACAGVGNSVFHPADFGILNAKVGKARLSHAFSMHAIGGNLGWAVAPMWSLAMATNFGWRYALIFGGAIGLAIAASLARQTELADDAPTLAAKSNTASTTATESSLVLFMRTPILMCFGFFTLWSTALVGIQTFAVPSLTALYHVPLVLATTCLTAYILGGAAGVFTGGFLAAGTARHTTVAASGMLAAALIVLWIATGNIPQPLLPVAFALAGFAMGTTSASRDLLVRANTPPGATGRVYGFVYAGLDVGAIIGPVLFGWYIDHGAPKAVFVSVAVFTVLAIATVTSLPQRRAALPQA